MSSSAASHPLQTHDSQTPNSGPNPFSKPRTYPARNPHKQLVPYRIPCALSLSSLGPLGPLACSLSEPPLYAGPGASCHGSTVKTKARYLTCSPPSSVTLPVTQPDSWNPPLLHTPEPPPSPQWVPRASGRHLLSTPTLLLYPHHHYPSSGVSSCPGIASVSSRPALPASVISCSSQSGPFR